MIQRVSLVTFTGIFFYYFFKRVYTSLIFAPVYEHSAQPEKKQNLIGLTSPSLSQLAQATIDSDGALSNTIF